MKLRKFLEEKMVEITTKFDMVQCRYNFDSACETHYIEILPQRIFDDSTLQYLQSDIYDQFDESYPNESLVFISSNSLTRMESSLFAVAGKSFYDVKTKLAWIRELGCSKSAHSDISTYAGDNNYALAA